MIPPDVNAAFVAAMEECSKSITARTNGGGRWSAWTRPPPSRGQALEALILETRASIPLQPGQLARHDYEYERNGTATLFMLLAPLEGWRRVAVSDRRAALD